MKIIDSNYGSIPHLSTSKLTQQADKKIEWGQEDILTKKARDWRDLVIVTEKIDGSNVGIVMQGNTYEPITRSGYPVESSPYKQHHAFGDWVSRNWRIMPNLPPGWRICGEWCLQAHGTLYDLTGECPFVAFDIFDSNNKRIKFMDFYSICSEAHMPMVPLLHIGQPISLKNAIKLLDKGHYGKPKQPEGVVYRVEKQGKVDFLAKWVRHDKEDGAYLPKKDTDEVEVWNKDAERYL
ncbi:MAG: hypothetical protein EOM67_08525 [Spirochaetia bacterium]|nr:hypothetical protein [Spirochaetia bacterium]